ncbi:hypothetical protein L207DRAFT_576917 [Hyaloscypha variabilis F]|uniref:Cora-domain-containing protein n=1 Tax=Hyaloscypha variabilis (strain UAMH 11265 / GT02V1 / F) TaxID=1149755 RepID=A0A2J6S5L4_HYAVF|nr:hypothetical protein L207DRAFT_576917 [Hyaloscypha variabilis F]
MRKLPRSDELDAAKSNEENNLGDDGVRERARMGRTETSEDQPTTQSDNIAEEGVQTPLSTVSDGKQSADQLTTHINKMSQLGQTSPAVRSGSATERPSQLNTPAEENEHATKIEPVSPSVEYPIRPSSNTYGEKQRTKESFSEVTEQLTCQYDNMAQQEGHDTALGTERSSSQSPVQSASLIGEPTETMAKPADNLNRPPSKAPGATAENAESRLGHSMESDVEGSTKSLLRGILMELKTFGKLLQRRTDGVVGKPGRAEASDSKQSKVSAETSSATTKYVPSLPLGDRQSSQFVNTSDIRFTDENDNVSLIKTGGRGFLDEVKAFASSEENLFSEEVDDLWTLPFDGRLLFKLQRRSLLTMGADVAKEYLEDLRSHNLGPKIFIKDKFANGSLLYRCFRFPADPRFGSTANSIASTRKETREANHGFRDFGYWQRFVSIQGLERSSIELLSGDAGQFLPGYGSIMTNYENLMCRINDYRERRQKTWFDSGHSDIPRNLSFHIKFYDLFTLADEDVAKYRTSHWRIGQVHSDHLNSQPSRSRRYLGQRAWSIFACSSLEKINNYIYPVRRSWTIVELQPYRSDHKFHNESNLYGYTPSDKYDVLHAFMHCIIRALSSVRESYEKIANYFDDNLLDKKYFWALTTLKELVVSVDANLQEIERLLSLPSQAETIQQRSGNREQQAKARFPEVDWSTHDLNRSRAKLRTLQDSLKTISTRFQGKYEEVTDLRIGLFNASGVMETRNSTRLGQNVMLLTYVSIFFLPLSFSMSVWSVNNTFSINRLWMTASILAVSTYVIVFNLNRLVAIFLRTYFNFFNRTVARMKTDEDETWAKRGYEFEKLSYKRKADDRISDWRIVQYILLGLLSYVLNSTCKICARSLTTRLKSYLTGLLAPKNELRNHGQAQDLEIGEQQPTATTTAPEQAETQPPVKIDLVNNPVGSNSQIAITSPPDAKPGVPKAKSGSAKEEPSPSSSFHSLQQIDVSSSQKGEGSIGNNFPVLAEEETSLHEARWNLLKEIFGVLIVDVVVDCVRRGPVCMEIITCAVALIERD